MDLNEITATYGHCRECSKMMGGPVLYEGQPSPLCFVAEALGQQEVAQKRPLIGPAGQLFNRVLKASGIKREECFLCNAVACRPPNNKLRGFEVVNCGMILSDLIGACNPKVIVTMGGTAIRALGLMTSEESVLAYRGRVLEYKGITVVATVHPAYILRKEDEAKRGAFSKHALLALKKNVVSDFTKAKYLLSAPGRVYA